MRYSRSWLIANLPVLFWTALMTLVFAETVALAHFGSASSLFR